MIKSLISCFFAVVFTWSGVMAQEAHVPGVLLIKLKPEYASFATESGLKINRLNPILERNGIRTAKQLFPNSLKPSSIRAPETQNRAVDISTIYELRFDEDIDVDKLARTLMNTQTLVYAEPRYIPKVTVVPSDDRIDSLWHLPVIRAFEAWDVDTGSSGITIAIVDTGVDMDHPDIVDKLWENTAEIPGNGLDDDQNGYIDDVSGWNFYNNNNDPDETGFSHGTHVAGIAGATVDNTIGVAGVGWASTIMVVKSGDKLELPYGYDGIVYAADHGADVINCSWGSFSASSFSHDIVQYATYNQGAVLTGGAGNDNRETLFYPASYPEVLSVAASDRLNQKADFSNYNYFVDVIAPGAPIYSLKNGGYGFDSGTSMAAPVVAGLAGLIKHRYPQLLPLQIAEQIKVTADAGFYDPDTNRFFEGKLGRGMVDMYKALLAIDSPGFSLEYFEVDDQDDQIFLVGESIYIGMEIANYLIPAGNVEVRLTSTHPAVSVQNGTWLISSLAQNARVNNLTTPFELQIEEETEANERVVLQVEIREVDTDFKVIEYIPFEINQDFVNVKVNEISATVSKHGLIGYTDYLQTRGIGFSLNPSDDLLFEGGLMIGAQKRGATRVVDRVRNGTFAEQDFWEETIIAPTVPRNNERFLAQGSFTDSSAIRDEIGLLIDQEVMAYDDEGHRNYVVVTYTVKNTSGDTLVDMSVGLFADWDVIDAGQNQARTAFGKRLGYVYYTGDEQVTAGIQALTLKPFNMYMIDNVRGGNGGVDLYDSTGYDSPEKYLTLTQQRLEAGNSDDDGNDVIQVIALEGVRLAPGQTESFTFALHAGRSIDQVLESADEAYLRFHGEAPGAGVAGVAELGSLWPNPTRDGLRLDVELSTSNRFDVQIIDLRGNILMQERTATLFVGYNQIEIDPPYLESGYYFLRIYSEGFVETMPFQFLAE